MVDFSSSMLFGTGIPDVFMIFYRISHLFTILMHFEAGAPGPAPNPIGYPTSPNDATDNGSHLQRRGGAVSRRGGGEDFFMIPFKSNEHPHTPFFYNFKKGFLSRY